MIPKRDVLLETMFDGVEESVKNEAAAYWCEQS